MKVKLTRIKSTHQNLRSDVIDGEADLLPTTGAVFAMTGIPFDSTVSGRRCVWTTPVISLERLDSRTLQFSTRNSTYRLEHEVCDDDQAT